MTGIHLASYGRDFKQNEEIDQNVENPEVDKRMNLKEYRLIDLLEEINKIDGIERIRLRFT